VTTVIYPIFLRQAQPCFLFKEREDKEKIGATEELTENTSTKKSSQSISVTDSSFAPTDFPAWVTFTV